MDTDVSALLGKVPLAEATWLLWNEVLPDEAVNACFDVHRGRCYEDKFTFANLVHLVNDALCQHGGRARQTLIRNGSSKLCPASEQAFYGKLRRMPIAVSEAFLADGSNRLRPWLSKRPYAEAPASLRDLRILVIDGKTFKKAAKRLKPVRNRAGSGLGGKALVAMELATGLLVGMKAHPDAHVNEASLVSDLLPSVRERLPGVRLWMADRQFGDLSQVRRCIEEGDHCVLRLHKHSVFTPDPDKPAQDKPAQDKPAQDKPAQDKPAQDKPARHGSDRNGRKWTDEVGTLSSTRQGKMTMRRITLERGEGEPPLEIVTDLLDADAYPADDLLELYRQRWGIEQVFQKVSEVFHLTHLIGSSPKAIIFQAALCMMLYNLLQVVRMIVADAADRPASTISTFNLLYDLNRELITLHFLCRPDSLIEALRNRAASIPDLRTYLNDRLRDAWTTRWIKSPPKKRHTKPIKHKRGTGGHFSIHRILVENEQSNDV